ncbi:hypothetical protein [Streptomyces sp. NPDC088801]|uniref:hypothetical protein n=1 Tax=Streptomyces sp. NPDC088801 TaxID=3365903 RepID=UPI0037FB85D1
MRRPARARRTPTVPAVPRTSPRPPSSSTSGSSRESLDSSVPAALKLKKRIKRFALDNELDHLPTGDIVSVALDEWLTARGF